MAARVERVLFVDDEETVREALHQWLTLAGYAVSTFETPEGALAEIDERFPGILVTDIRMPRMDGLAVLESALARDPEIPVLLVTGHGDVPMAVEAMRRGAYDFIEKPFVPERLVDAIGRACEKRHLTLRLRRLHASTDAQGIEGRLIGTSRAMETLRREVLDLAATPVNVVINGETGSGKELVAQCLHAFSARREGRFVAVNCGAIPDTMMESELFGYEAGAFTGALKRRIGKLEYAHRGTLFLDEIEAMPLLGQVKLLRVLQERRVERLGANEAVATDLRTLCASKVDLRAEAQAGLFRPDLYYRLGVAELRIPPLRERQEDIPLLFEHFAAQAAEAHGRAMRPLGGRLVADLVARAWPGNVRELRNAAERYAFGLDRLGAAAEPVEGGPQPLAARVEAYERDLIGRALQQAKGNVAEAMRLLDLPRRTLNEKMQRYGLSRTDYNE
ncbi:two-component system, NtrC family, C4-dicarboxylate transport response regulator DctD [Methylobacterium sp. 174MFSha1.1]|uniref:sigma-54-dependent transcriptional regulator n=1 Tax=Methylobacterium sp. 174MFSha1.1 TaxID=1502749 RepID=UPI0008EBF366|nr:sigma-54 dependent transcriptional regulator [Methylobacterium sp. 174MFSha1.1]SFU75818.1 two-component system, NtrC family, C4-dicarboxylate transport response regulator DctD [Methylobacterium sp. 174MFSha1.1]